MKLYKDVGKIRVYSPQRRVIKVSGRYYKLPFPHMAFYNVDSLGLVVGFVDKYCETIIPAFLPHISNGFVCLGNDASYYSFNECITGFWQTSFRGDDFHDTWSLTLFRKYVKTFANWEQMSLEEIQDIVSSVVKEKYYNYGNYIKNYDVTNTFKQFMGKYGG